MIDFDGTPIPPSWAIAQLSAVARINPKLDKSKVPDDLKVSFVPMPAVEAGTGKMDVSTHRRFGDVKKGYTSFKEGDVLFAKITPCMENGKMAVVPAVQNGHGLGSTEFHVLRPNNGISAKFLYYFVSSQRFRHDAEHKMTGAVGQRRVPTTYLSEQHIRVPPSSEQSRIVGKIEEVFSELDHGVESLARAREQLKVYRQAVLKHAFEGKLTAGWRKQNRDRVGSAAELRANLATERQAHYQSLLAAWTTKLKEWKRSGSQGAKPPRVRLLEPVTPLSSEVLEALSELPAGWAWEKLAWLTCGVDYGTAAKSSKTGAVPVIRMGNLQNGGIDWSDLAFTDDADEIRQYELSTGDILFNRTNSPELVGKTAIYRGERPAIFAGYLIRVNHNPAVVDGQYLNLFLNSHVARQYGNTVKTDGVNQSNINGEKLQGYPFPFCPLSEQQEIVRLLDEKLSCCDRLLREIDDQLERANALRQSIIKKAFAGQLAAQNPNDEPASVLLERIRAEKECPGYGPKKSNKNNDKKEAA